MLLVMRMMMRMRMIIMVIMPMMAAVVMLWRMQAEHPYRDPAL